MTDAFDIIFRRFTAERLMTTNEIERVKLSAMYRAAEKRHKDGAAERVVREYLDAARQATQRPT